MPVHRIVQFGFVNAYLVEEEDGLTLIDTMLPRERTRRSSPRPRRSARRSSGSRSRTHTATTSGRSTSSTPRCRAPRCSSPAATRGCSRRTSRWTPASRRQAQGDYPGARTRPTRTVEPASGSARSRFTRRPATHRARSRSSTSARRHAVLRRRLLDAGRRRQRPPSRTRASRCRRWPRGTGRPRWSPRGRCARSTRRGSRPGHGGVVEAPGAAMDRAIARGA